VIQVVTGDEGEADPMSLNTRLLIELREGHEDPRAAWQALAHKGAGKFSDLVNPDLPRLPPLALHDPSLALMSKHQIDVAVGTTLPSAFPNIPVLTAEEFPDEPFELLGAQEAEVGSPLHEVAPVSCLDLNKEITDGENSSPQRADDVGRNQSEDGPMKPKGQQETGPRVKEKCNAKDDPPGYAVHEAENSSCHEIVGIGRSSCGADVRATSALHESDIADGAGA
jgi:hypothetical protein